MKQASFWKVFLWSAAISWVVIVVVLTPLRMANMGVPFWPALGLTTVLGLGVACLLGFMIAGSHYIAKKSRQERTVRLPCWFERACELCRASLALFPGCELRKDATPLAPGAFVVLVRNNPLLSPVPGKVRPVLPNAWNWMEVIEFTVRSVGDGESVVTLVARLDANSVMHALTSRGGYNMDRVVQFLEEKVRAV